MRPSRPTVEVPTKVVRLRGRVVRCCNVLVVNGDQVGELQSSTELVQASRVPPILATDDEDDQVMHSGAPFAAVVELADCGVNAR